MLKPLSLQKPRGIEIGPCGTTSAKWTLASYVEQIKYTARTLDERRVFRVCNILSFDQSVMSNSLLIVVVDGLMQGIFFYATHKLIFSLWCSNHPYMYPSQCHLIT